jgi:hypothetical protein
LRRGWTKFSLCISAVIALFLTAAASPRQSDEAARRANELSVAGLRPGRDALTDAFKRYKQKYLSSETVIVNLKEWRDTCTGRALVIGVDARSIIQEITVSSLHPQEGKCDDRRFEALNLKGWITGRGLRIGDSRDRVIDLYGEPNSSGPAVKQSHELELLEFSFGWAGPEVPQAMQIYCERETGRVVEITLANSRPGQTTRDKDP